jgi:probable F420-dependent oxidoreductase
VTLTAIAQRTRSCTIGSGIMYGVGRTPLMLAAEARDLDEISHGRLILGLGTGTRRMIADSHGLDGDRPAARMEELVPLLRRLWRLSEAPVHHDGRFYGVHIQALDDLDGERVRDIPVFTAGVNPRMIESAGRVADGFLGHTLFSPRYLREVALPAIARGAERAGRDHGDVSVVTFVLASAGEDEDLARRDAAAMIAFYGSVKTYGALFERCGFGPEAGVIREAFARRDVDGMVAAVSEAMVEEFALAGTPEQVAGRLARFDGLVDEVVLFPPSFRATPERAAQNLAALVAACAPSADGTRV